MSLFQILLLFCIQHGQLREFISGFVVVYKTVNFASLFQILFCSQDCEPLQVCFRFCFVLFCLLDGQLCEFVSDFVLFCIQHGQLREFTSGFVVVYKTVNFVNLCKFVSDFVLFCFVY